MSEPVTNPNNKSIYELIEKNDKELLKFYLSSMKDKLEKMNSTTDKLSILGCFIVVIYFLIEQSYINKVDLLFVEITKLNIGLILIPSIFSFFLLYYIILSVHRSKIIRSSKIISYFLFKGEIKDLDKEVAAENIIIQFLPFSLWEEMNKMNFHTQKIGCISAILSVPLIFLIYFPYWFEYYSLKKIFIEFWSQGYIPKISFIWSIWCLIYSTFFLIRYYVIVIKKNDR